jgi:hypothetical protein
MRCLAKLRTEERISLASQDNQLADDRRHRTHAQPSHHLPHRIPCRKGYRAARDPQVPKNCGAVELMPRCVRACVLACACYYFMFLLSVAVRQ